MVEEGTDEELLNAYFEGNAAAFEIFFKRHIGKVVAYAVKKGISQSEAYDVAQEAFTKLHRKIGLYERGKPALPWFFSIVQNSSIDWYRSRSRSCANSHNLEELHDKLPVTLGPSFEDLELDDSLETGLRVLSKEQRSVIEMRVVNDLSFKDIAASTGKSEVALRKIYQRAMEQLRKVLK